MSGASEIIDRINGYIAREMPALAGARCVVAVSGGADSVAMADMLASECGVLPPAGLTIAHFDHRLRDAGASARDRANVEALGARLAVPCVIGAWDAPRAGEAAARDARYAFLARVAADAGARFVVTGHTADDQAETVVMHAMRGAGLYGLAGMAPVAVIRDGRGVSVARPLLCATREETRAWCASRGLAFADDATNDDTRMLRNRVRRDVLPAMEAASPGARSALTRIAEDARTLTRALEPVAAAAIAGTAEDGIVVLRRAALRAMPPDAGHIAWRMALVRLLGDARDFGRRHYAMLERATGAHAGTTVVLPRGVIATVDAREVVLSRGAVPAAPVDPLLAAPLPFAGEAGAWQLEVRRAGDGDGIALPRDAVVRARRPGDRIRPRGMRGTKKLQDYYVDRKVPRRWRDAAPVIAAGAVVLWTPFGAGAEDAGGERYIVRAARTGGWP